MGKTVISFIWFITGKQRQLPSYTVCLYCSVFSPQLDDIIVWHQSGVQKKRNKMKKLIGKELLKHRVILDSLLFHHIDLYVQECVY